MPPKNLKKQVGKKRKKDSPPPDPDTDDSASGTEGETGGEAETQGIGNGDAEEDNIRPTRSAVHNEYNQTSESVEVKSKNGKKIKVTKWESACKHCPKVFAHKKHWGLKRHLMTKHH